MAGAEPLLKIRRVSFSFDLVSSSVTTTISSENTAGNDNIFNDHRILPIYGYLLRVVRYGCSSIKFVALKEDIRRHKALPNAEDIGPLKALLAYDALVHPDHPLRKKGIDGIELFIGMRFISQYSSYTIFDLSGPMVLNRNI